MKPLFAGPSKPGHRRQTAILERLTKAHLATTMGRTLRGAEPTGMKELFARLPSWAHQTEETTEQQKISKRMPCQPWRRRWISNLESPGEASLEIAADAATTDF